MKIARELEEAGRKGVSHGMIAAVNLLKIVGCGHTRNSKGVRNEDGIVVTNEMENKKVFTRYSHARIEKINLFMTGLNCNWLMRLCQPIPLKDGGYSSIISQG